MNIKNPEPLITDEETNFVYFSGLLKKWYEPEYERIISILDEYKVKHDLLKGTKDIWCRDYCPVQISEREFVQFKYEPSYLNGFGMYKSDPFKVNEKNYLREISYCDVNLDGGNIVKAKNKVIISD